MESNQTTGEKNFRHFPTKALTEQEIQSLILYRDSLMFVINKPAGLPVHAGPKGGPNLEDSFEWLKFGLPRPPSLAHRLDRDTSGCLILGRHRKALGKLGKLFSGGRISKTYWAIVKGIPEDLQGTIDLPIKKKTTDKRSWWMEVAADGQKSVTNYKVAGSYNGYSWLIMEPKTGRTHQLRVHCAHMGWPIIGDPVYGKPQQEQDQDKISLQLHAASISVPLYPSKPAIEVRANPPEHMLYLLEKCGYNREYNNG